MKTYVFYVTPNGKAHNLVLAELFLTKKLLFSSYKKMCSKMHVLGDFVLEKTEDLTIILVCVLNYDEEINLSALDIVKNRVLNKHKDAILNTDDLLEFI